MNKKHLFALLFTLLVWTSCNNQQHFITDAAYRAEVENDFQAKQAALPNGDLFAVFNDQMTPEEREALTFMYAYMPIGDITDYSGDFYLKNIRSSFQARNEMPWGDSIPEDIFRHFVLPVRINNENLDESRMVFFDELKDRVKGLSLYDAVLEVNHWCHEKVIYTPSDGRTSSPLASVKTAYGRCGEESTFTVAALRSVGIPARQVYTPRWAHTDDNHAWVEAWVNGKWYFLGACEPEPVLNLGWFNGPAYRGMLMHTKVFGKYNGPEDIMERTDGYTEINVIDNYAPSAKAVITVTDANGKPVKSSYKVKPLDVITVMMDRPRYENEIIPEDIPLTIVYEDPYVMVVNKPAGLVVHPGHGNYHGTLVNALAWHMKDIPDYDANDPHVGLVHRIDKDTSGLLVIAKTPDAKTNLGIQFFNKTTKRKYRALVWGRRCSAPRCPLRSRSASLRLPHTLPRCGRQGLQWPPCRTSASVPASRAAPRQ